eukprot:358378-Chlamydomonas_euryale.AAC.7
MGTVSRSLQLPSRAAAMSHVAIHRRQQVLCARWAGQYQTTMRQYMLYGAVGVVDVADSIYASCFR